MYVSNFILHIAELLTAMGVVFGMLWGGFKFIHRQQQQDKDIEALYIKHDNDIKDIKGELQVICFGMLACLDGLKQQGCNGDVTKAHDKLTKHLNISSHSL